MLTAVLLLAFEASAGMAFAPKSPDPVYAPLFLYKGTWQITRSNLAAGEKPDLLVNQCELVGRYFTCQQTVNGQVSGLVVFIPSKEAGHYFTQNILPEGRATGRDELEISGDHWTYTSRRQEGGKVTHYRTTNAFQGKNKIHFEQSESTDGTTWAVKGSGDEVRTAP